jgi:hypothetical protein
VGDSLWCLDNPRQGGAGLALYLVQQYPSLAEVYPLDDLQVGHWRERAGPEGHKINEHLDMSEVPNVDVKTNPGLVQNAMRRRVGRKVMGVGRGHLILRAQRGCEKYSNTEAEN